MDPVYFMKKYCLIQHPTKGKINCNLYPFQEKVLRLFQKYPDSVFLGSFVLFIVAFQMAIKEPLLESWWATLDHWVLATLPWLAGLVVSAVQFNRVKLHLTKKYLLALFANIIAGAALIWATELKEGIMQIGWFDAAKIVLRVNQLGASGVEI